MDALRTHMSHMIALLFMGGAILLISCKSTTTVPAAATNGALLTQQSENLTILYSQDGNQSYRFTTPLLERYESRNEPYMEFRKGVEVITFNDSTHMKESTLTANYAIFMEKQKLWEAKGNVIVRQLSGQTLETEQLFWNQATKRIYSNVDSKVTQGEDVILGEGFESDEAFVDFTFRKPKGKVAVDVLPTPVEAPVGVVLPPAATSAESDPAQAPPTIREGEAVARPKSK